jgi:hypothetical protein
MTAPTSCNAAKIAACGTRHRMGVPLWAVASRPVQGIHNPGIDMTRARGDILW